MKVRVKIENEIYEVEIENLDTRPILATVDGETFEVWPEEHGNPHVVTPALTPIAVSAPGPTPTAGQVDQISELASTILPSSVGTEQKTVTAPIPGVIIAIIVKEGDTVEIGQELCVLEAMKMKNSIRAGRSGVIVTVHVTIGDTVSHGQPLFDFAD